MYFGEVGADFIDFKFLLGSKSKGSFDNCTNDGSYSNSDIKDFGFFLISVLAVSGPLIISVIRCVFFASDDEDDINESELFKDEHEVDLFINNFGFG